MLKLNAILVPVDFSARSLPAAKHSAALARHFQSKMIFLHVVPPSPYEYAAFEGGYYTGATWASEETEDRLKKELDLLVEKTSPEPGVEKLILHGDPPNKIEELARDRDVQLVVMPTHGFGPFRRFVLGSVTTKVLHDVGCPVLTGAHVKEIPPGTSRPYEHVACAIDLGERSAEVLRWGSEFARSYGANLSALHAVPYLEHISLGELVREAEEKVGQLLSETGAQAEVIIASEDLHEFVRTTVEERNIDLLVIGRSHREGILGRLRTHAYGLIRESPCPVISI